MAPRFDPDPRPRLLKGGQGRSEQEVETSAAVVAVSAICAAIVLLVCAFPQIALYTGVTLIGAIGLVVAGRGR